MKKITLTFVAAVLSGWDCGFAVESPSSLTEQTSGFRFSSQGHLLLQNAKDPEDPLAKATSLFSHENALRGEYGRYSLGIHFSNRFTPDGARALVSPFVLEKKTLAAEWSSLRVDLGDSHQELGRGIALSLYRDPVFGVDTTVEGVSLRWEPDGAGVSAFGGRLNAQKIPVALNPLSNPLQDREFWVAGVSGVVRVAAPMKVGGHYLYTYGRPLGTSPFRESCWHTVGATVSLEGVADEIDVYAESNALFSKATASSADLPVGYGSYGAISWSPLPWKIKVEAKDYRNYYYDFRRPPTLEEDVVITLNTEEVSAARFAIERRLGQGKDSLYGSYLVGFDRNEKAPLHHGVVGTKLQGPWRSSWEWKGGYRTIVERNDLWHASLKSAFPTFKGQTIEAEVRKQLARRGLLLASTPENRNLLSLSYTFTEKFSAQLGYEHVPIHAESSQKHFFNAGATYKVGPWVARAFAGQTSGGTQCSGGVCRLVPAFTGAYLDTTYTF